MNDEKTPKPGEENGASEEAQPEPPAENAEQPEAADGEAEASGWSKGDLEALREENADLRDKLLRTVAEMENLRRRTERDKSDTAKFAISNFARDVLTIADNIQRAIDHVPEEAAESDPALKSFREGIQVTERELLNVMERHGINRIDPKGERFDPNAHQAMFEVENKDVADGTIVEVVQAGYVIADRVLRPAMVGVAKGGPKAAKPAPAEATAPDPAKPEAAKAKGDGQTKGDEKSGDKPPKDPKPKGMGGKIDKSA